MIRALFALGLLVAVALPRLLPEGVALYEPARLSLTYGFLLLAAYLAGDLGKRFGLPRVCGYLLAGVALGPWVLGIVDAAVAAQMKLIDDLALAIIALTAGAELHLPMIRARGRTIGLVSVALAVGAAAALAAAAVALASLFPFARGMGVADLWVMGAILGVVGVSCSPAATIAIIEEVGARGPFTDTVLAVTVVMDAMVVLLFAAAVAVGLAVIGPGQGFDVGFLGQVAAQLATSVAAGAALGLGVAYYMRRVDRYLPVLLVVLAFLVAEGARWVAHALDASVGVAFHLEPLLVCIAAGFMIQNFTREGERLLETLGALAAPIFVVFFSMAGVGLELGALAATWGAALAFVAVRSALVSGAGFAGAVAGGETRRFGRWAGLGFYAQAGISLGLAQEVARRFPGWGAEVAAFLVATIALNQLIGPVVFQVALKRMDEAAPPRRGRSSAE